jgi:hypothetical protein
MHAMASTMFAAALIMLPVLTAGLRELVPGY